MGCAQALELTGPDDASSAHRNLSDHGTADADSVSDTDIANDREAEPTPADPAFDTELVDLVETRDTERGDGLEDALLEVSDVGDDDPELTIEPEIVDSREPDSGDADNETVDTCEKDCTGLECGLDPICSQSCGECDDPDFPSCNGGQCEYRCDPARCSEQSFCEEGECRGDPFCAESGVLWHTCHDFTCSPDMTACEEVERDEMGSACVRDTDGWEAPDSRTTHDCGNFADDCDGSGKQAVTAQICRNGEPGHEFVELSDCTRETTGLNCTEGDLTGLCFDEVCCIVENGDICPE